MVAVQGVLPANNDWAMGWEAIAAIATFLAVVASVWFALHANAVRTSDERKQAKAMADALCDELRAVHWRLEQLEALPDDGNIERAWRAYERHLEALVTPVLDKFYERLQVYDGSTAILATSAYGNLLRMRELMSSKPTPPFDRTNTDLYWQAVRGLRTTIPPVRERVRKAVLALWKYTPHRDKDPFAEDIAEA